MGRKAWRRGLCSQYYELGSHGATLAGRLFEETLLEGHKHYSSLHGSLVNVFHSYDFYKLAHF
jgi:hypothetical protein